MIENRIVAIITDRGVHEVIPEAYRLLGDEETWFLATTGKEAIHGEHVASRGVLSTLLELVSRGGMIALLSHGAVCNESPMFLKNGVFARLAICSLAPLAREAIITGQPPRPARRSPIAVLHAYVQRLVRNGASIERLAAKIAVKAGGNGAGVLVDNGKRRYIVLAVSERPWLCIRYLGSAAIGVISYNRDPGCRSRVVARLELVHGVVRLVYHEIDKILYG